MFSAQTKFHMILSTCGWLCLWARHLLTWSCATLTSQWYLRTGFYILRNPSVQYFESTECSLLRSVVRPAFVPIPMRILRCSGQIMKKKRKYFNYPKSCFGKANQKTDIPGKRANKQHNLHHFGATRKRTKSSMKSLYHWVSLLFYHTNDGLGSDTVKKLGQLAGGNSLPVPLIRKLHFRRVAL